MNVYEFNYVVDYGRGVALIAAPDQKTAIKISSELPTGFGHWEYYGLFNGLTYDTTEPGIIMELSYAE